MKCMYCKHSVYPGCDDDYVAECELVGKDYLVHEDEAKTCPFFDSKIELKVLGEKLRGSSIMAELGQGIYDAMHKKSKDDDSINWRNELITKGAAVDALKDNMLRLTLAEEQRCEGHVVWGEDVVFADVLEKALLVLPSAQPQWIPVTERLPEEYKDVLCYYEYFRYGDYNCMFRTIDRGYYGNGRWGGEAGQGHKNKVLAWMPLPEPYKEGE